MQTRFVRLVGGVRVVSIWRPKIVAESQDQASWKTSPEPDSPTLDRKQAAHATTAQRDRDRLERDFARGYSINVKQVILAFAVEFVIIGLILTSQFLYAAQLPNASRFVILQTLLFPIALAMVELARVPLAIAVRTQKSWNIQFAALLGVACAVVVTSASLYQIGNFTFNPRLEAVHAQREHLDTIQKSKEAFNGRKQAAQDTVDEHAGDFKLLSDRYTTLTSQLNAQPPMACNVVSGSPNADGSPGPTKQVCRENPALKTLRAELDATKVKLAEFETSKRRSESEFAKFDSKAIDDELNKAQRDYRDAIFQSPLHSYTAMLFNVDPNEVSEGQVKTLEWYLILIPSIAAALSSTLIAMTAVHRVRRPKSQMAPTVIPDDAANFLFGPLIAAIKGEAADAVETAVKSRAKPKAKEAG